MTPGDTAGTTTRVVIRRDPGSDNIERGRNPFDAVQNRGPFSVAIRSPARTRRSSKAAARGNARAHAARKHIGHGELLLRKSDAAENRQDLFRFQLARIILTEIWVPGVIFSATRDISPMIQCFCPDAT
jgi:hypothetical protein